jgi:hypothetical protein
LLAPKKKWRARFLYKRCALTLIMDRQKHTLRLASLVSRCGSIHAIYCQANDVSRAKPSLKQLYSQHMYQATEAIAEVAVVVRVDKVDRVDNEVSEVTVVSVRKETDHAVETVVNARKGIDHRVHRENARVRGRVRHAHWAIGLPGRGRGKGGQDLRARKETDLHVRVESSNLWQGQNNRTLLSLRHRMQHRRLLQHPQHL